MSQRGVGGVRKMHRRSELLLALLPSANWAVVAPSITEWRKLVSCPIIIPKRQRSNAWTHFGSVLEIQLPNKAPVGWSPTSSPILQSFRFRLHWLHLKDSQVRSYVFKLIPLNIVGAHSALLIVCSLDCPTSYCVANFMFAALYF